MCGIAGVYAFTENGQKAFENVNSASKVLSKRGPDKEGIYQGRSAILAHRRLSIIDISCLADQPMHSQDGRYTIIFNGEIFNFRELKNQYFDKEQQAQLRSQSDTEVLLEMYSRLKEAVFPLLQGFFALAIYDNDTSELLLARDRFGKKPLLYYADADMLCFASEMKALFASGIPKEVNWSLLPVYLQLNYVPAPFSLVKGVQKLEPGHYLKVSKTGITESAYFQLNIRQSDYATYTYEGAQDRLITLMDKAVQKRMIADVPLGAFLSGGIDSSVVVALASRHTQKLHTFSIGYKDHPFFDETSYAKLVAARYKTEHTVFSLGNEDFLEHVHNVLDYLDEPFADSSAIPEYILCYHTRRHVTVALSGDGGDEVFAGYNKHAAEWKMRQGGFQNNLVKAGGPIWSRLPHSRNNKVTNIFRQLARFAEGANLSAADRYWKWASFLKKGQAFALLNPRIRQQVDAAMPDKIMALFTKEIQGRDLNEVLLADMNLVLQSDMLPKVDLMSMANSLEIRSPFLDSDVVDFAFGLPATFKVDATLKKKIVQDAFRSHLPEELYNRPKKGFEIPLLDWFRKELWGLINDDLLQDSFVEQQGIFDLTAIQHLKRQLHSSNPGDSHATIWALLVFQHWWKRHMAA